MPLTTVQAAWVQHTHNGMGTLISHKLLGAKAESCLNALQAEVARIEKTLSRFLPESEISRINRSAGIRSERISRETFNLLEQAVTFSQASQGCFKLTIGPLVSLWAQSKITGILPTSLQIDQALALVNDADLILDPQAQTARLKKPGQSIDLGGIGKGFAADRLYKIFDDFEISSAYSNLGGNVVTKGAKPDGSPWWIGIQHPRREGGLLGSVAVVGQSVVTSGDYQRYFTDQQGVCRHHILDPQTGYPSRSGLISVSIISRLSIVADALSTILFVSGIEKGIAVLKNYPEAEAIFMDEEEQVFITPGLQNNFVAAPGIRLG